MRGKPPAASGCISSTIRSDPYMKLPRNVSGAAASGFTITRQVGSHARLASGGRRVTVPMHSALAPAALLKVQTKFVNSANAHEDLEATTHPDTRHARPGIASRTS